MSRPSSPRPSARTSSVSRGARAPMQENIHRFFRAARGAGVRISPAESIDAMRAVASVGIADRNLLRDTFLLTLAKSADEKRALGDCFDLFFAPPQPLQPANDAESADEASSPAGEQRRDARRRAGSEREPRAARPDAAERAIPPRSRRPSPPRRVPRRCPRSAISPSAACSRAAFSISWALRGCATISTR